MSRHRTYQAKVRTLKGKFIWESEEIKCGLFILDEVSRNSNNATRKSKKIKRKFKINAVNEIPPFKEICRQKLQLKAQRTRYEKRFRFYR